ncbi:MAG: branched-chain amino acid transaminase [Pseudomonadota bacterium]
MPLIRKLDYIWIDGEMVAWDEAVDHVLAHTLHYGLGAFEGIRAYQQNDGKTAVFRLDEHLERLIQSCRICTIDIPYGKEALKNACLEVIRQNRLAEAYLRPIAYLGYGAMGLGSLEPPVRTVIAAFEWGAYLGEEGVQKGIRVRVSSLRRAAIDAMMSKGKICGQYVNSVLAKREAMRDGYDEALLLDGNGHVAEGSGENVFIVRGGIIQTTPTSSCILAGITRDSVIRIARDLGYHIEERVFTVDELWCADEVFLTGTAAEITPVRESDGRKIGTGEPGPVTRRLQGAFREVTKSNTGTRYSEWLTYL